MATVSAVILKSGGKKDGTWNVKIRLWHKGKPKYIPTEHFVTARQVKNDGSLKDPIILQLVNPVVDDYRVKISQLGPKLKAYSVERLEAYLTGEMAALMPEEIDVISFGREMINDLRTQDREASANDIRRVVNSLVDYFKSEFVPISEITAKLLRSFEKYLRTPRTITRLNQFKRPVTVTKKGAGDTGVRNYMRDLRILFKAMQEYYNDEDKGLFIIKHYPFRKMKIAKPTPSRFRNLAIDELIAIRDMDAARGSRVELARDLIMLSFYFCGTNAADLYEMDAAVAHKDRYEFERAKTRGQRGDNAFISMAIPNVARPLIEKWAGKLPLRYKRSVYLDAAIAKGIKGICKILELPHFDFYSVRHTFSDLAHNTCRFSFDDVALALNHGDKEHRVTRIYVSRYWGIVDEVQEAVIALLPKRSEPGAGDGAFCLPRTFGGIRMAAPMATGSIVPRPGIRQDTGGKHHLRVVSEYR